MQTQSHLDMLIGWVGQWGLWKEFTNGSAAMGIAQFVGIALVLMFISWGIYSYQERVKYALGYDLFDWVNIAWHTGLWLLFWLLYICNCYGRDELQPSCPVVATVVLFCVWLIPTWRTYRETRCLSESVMINIFQTIFGLVIASILFVIMAFSCGGKKRG